MLAKQTQPWGQIIAVRITVVNVLESDISLSPHEPLPHRIIVFFSILSTSISVSEEARAAAQREGRSARQSHVTDPCLSSRYSMFSVEPSGESASRLPKRSSLYRIATLSNILQYVTYTPYGLYTPHGKLELIGMCRYLVSDECSLNWDKPWPHVRAQLDSGSIITRAGTIPVL